jgi:hypothetical protein
MGKENSAGLGVYNVYGPRKTDEGRSGSIKTAGVVKELELDFRGENYGIVSATIPAGATVLDGYAKVSEAFALGGTTPTIAIGTSGSAATNGVKLTEAQAEATGSYDLTPAGTWGSTLAASTSVAVELGGTSPTIGNGGNVKVVIRYVVL